jgi:hypothetical protein
VKIDNLHDAFATIIRVDVGETTELLDTVRGWGPLADRR